jgi:cold shock CspA family protein
MRGRVVQYNRARGFGFLAPTDGQPQVFCHLNEWRRSGIDETKFREGTWLEWDTRPSPYADKPEACDVRLLRDEEIVREAAWGSRPSDTPEGQTAATGHPEGVQRDAGFGVPFDVPKGNT